MGYSVSWALSFPLLLTLIFRTLKAKESPRVCRSFAHSQGKEAEAHAAGHQPRSDPGRHCRPQVGTSKNHSRGAFGVVRKMRTSPTPPPPPHFRQGLRARRNRYVDTFLPSPWIQHDCAFALELFFGRARRKRSATPTRQYELVWPLARTWFHAAAMSHSF